MRSILSTSVKLPSVRLRVRILGVPLFFLSIFIAPWWLSLALGLALLLYCRAYEVVLGGVMTDLLYASPVPSWGGTTFATTALFLLCALAAFVLHRRLLLYH